MDKERFPNIIISWLDIAKGVGEIALEFLTKRFHENPTPNHSEHFTPYDYDGIEKPPGQ